MDKLTNIIKTVGTLETKDLEALSVKILELLKMPSVTCSESANGTNHIGCRKCGSNFISKYGKDKNGKQRYKCKSCNTIFYETSFSVVSKSRNDLSKWKKYITLLLQGASLAKCASACSISVQTAFAWRHKILHALQNDQTDRILGGVIEIDDMFFSISYKGNHKNSKKFQMPRKAYKRGTDNKGKSAHKACVLCAVERQGQTYAEVVGVGRATANMLQYAFAERLLSDSIALTDKAPEYNQYFAKTSIELISLSSHSDRNNALSPPEVKGPYHIQNVNNLHSRIRKALRVYNGVSTKYLNHYINLFVWIENYKKTAEYALANQMLQTIQERNSYISYADIVMLPPIPLIA